MNIYIIELNNILKHTKHAMRKRVKITGTGKILRRSTGLNHFRSRKSQKNIKLKRKALQVSRVDVKIIKQII